MNTFAFLGDYGLSLLELALQDEDPMVRMVSPDAQRIYSLDWLDDYTLIFDRMEGTGVMGYNAVLKRLARLLT